MTKPILRTMLPFALVATLALVEGLPSARLVVVASRPVKAAIAGARRDGGVRFPGPVRAGENGTQRGTAALII